MPSPRASAAVDRDYVKTNTGDLVSRKAHVHGSQNLYLKGKVSNRYPCYTRSEGKYGIMTRLGRACSSTSIALLASVSYISEHRRAVYC